MTPTRQFSFIHTPLFNLSVRPARGSSSPSAALRSDVPAQVGSRPSTGVSLCSHCGARSLPPVSYALCPAGSLLLFLSYQIEMRADSLLVVGFTISGRSGVGGAPLPQMLAEVGAPPPGFLQLAERASRRGNSKEFMRLIYCPNISYISPKEEKNCFKINVYRFVFIRISFFPVAQYDLV